MRVLIVTPAPRGSRRGNRITAERWARLLRTLGHQVIVRTRYAGERADLAIMLHAVSSATSIRRWRRLRPRAPLIVALTGTDMTGRALRTAQRPMELADRLVVLHPLAVAKVPRVHRHKVRVIVQSARRPPRIPPHRRDRFEVGILGHLRPIKDSFRAAIAAQRLPASSRIVVLQIGGVLTAAMARRARREEQRNARYRWVGELPRTRALRLLGRCRLAVLSSRHEGGANMISEAAVLGVPILATRIAGCVGLLGRDYPGYFAVGDTKGLARLLLRAEQDRRFLRRLREHVRRLESRFRPSQERRAWLELLRELEGNHYPNTPIECAAAQGLTAATKRPPRQLLDDARGSGRSQRIATLRA